MGKPWSPRAAPTTWAVVLVAVVSLARATCSMVPATPLASRAGFAEAVTHLDTRVRAGTFVVVWPPDQAAALSELPAAWPAADAVPLEAVDRRHFLEILVIGPRGFPSPPELDAAEADERIRFTDIEVGAYRWPRSDRVDFDLSSNLARVTVRMTGDEEDIACDRPRPHGGWSCPGRPSWNHVGPVVLPVDGHDWPAVWAHPVEDRELVIELGPQTLWDRIELEAALHDAVTDGRHASVVARLEVEGIGSRRLVRTDRRGVARVSLPTPRGERAAVRVVITTAKSARRHFGINLRIVEAR